ncbi:MAG: hypothetical protein ACKV2T_41520 [Kofleriaceae bacterium]
MRARSITSTTALACLLASCWSSPAPRPPPPQNVVPPDAVAAPPPLPARTIWTGRYECGQGVTAVHLTLDVEPSGRARAIFDFGPLADNPTVPNGSFRLIGKATPADDAIDVWLRPEEWIDRPPGYEMVGIHVGIDARRRSLRGKMLNDSCDWLDAKRVD